jgi:phosphoenolpyruvate-protein kinase (PTS system EI component)
MLRTIVRAGRRRNIRVSVCGEMAADPVLLTLLVGLGLTEFSMSPTAIPLAKQVLRDLNAADARASAGRALRAATAADVERELVDFLAPRVKR